MLNELIVFFTLVNCVFLYMIVKENKEEKFAQKEFEEEQLRWGL